MGIVGFSLMKIISVTDGTSYDLEASCHSCLSRLSMEVELPASLTSEKSANCMRANLNSERKQKPQSVRYVTLHATESIALTSSSGKLLVRSASAGLKRL
jgi:hypothetical protein